DPPHVVDPEGRHGVEALPELLRVTPGEEPVARGDHLPELDVRGPKVLERHPPGDRTGDPAVLAAAAEPPGEAPDAHRLRDEQERDLEERPLDSEPAPHGLPHGGPPNLAAAGGDLD